MIRGYSDSEALPRCSQQSSYLRTAILVIVIAVLIAGMVYVSEQVTVPNCGTGTTCPTETSYSSTDACYNLPDCTSTTDAQGSTIRITTGP